MKSRPHPRKRSKQLAENNSANLPLVEFDGTN